MNAGDFMVDWFLPILTMVILGAIVIGWLITLAIYGYKCYKRDKTKGTWDERIINQRKS